PDLTGHGSAPPLPEPTPFTFHTDVERVVAMLRGDEPAHVIGHSYGGLIALRAALAAPETIRSLTVYDPVAFGALDPVAGRDALAPLEEVDLTWGPGPEDRERWLRNFVDFWSGAGAWASLREDARAEFRRVAWAIREGVRTLTEDRTPAATYAALGRPLRLVTGERSPLPARRVVERIAAAAPGATLTVVPGVGHLRPVSDPAALNPS